MTDFQPSRQQSDLADVVEMLLDKGVVINADIAVSIADTQLLGIQVRAAIASFDTAARYGLEFPEGTDMERLAEAIDEPELAARERRRKVAVAPTRGVNVSPEPGEDDGGDDGEGDRGTKRFAARPDPEQPIDDGIDIGGSEEHAQRAGAEPAGEDEGDGGDAGDDEDADSSEADDSSDADSESADEEATAATTETEGNGDGD